MHDVEAKNAQLERHYRQLRRLEVLIDVVFGLVLWRLFILIPRPSAGDWESLKVFLNANSGAFVEAGLGLAIVIIYWLQNNSLFGYLQRTDNRHTAIAIAQLFFLLLFLYAVSFGVDFSGVAPMLFESVTVALVGIASVSGWAYARKDRRLLSSEITDSEAAQLLDRTLAEPVTALITLPCAFVSPLVWDLAWLAYLPVSYAFHVRRRKQNKPTTDH